MAISDGFIYSKLTKAIDNMDVQPSEPLSVGSSLTTNNMAPGGNRIGFGKFSSRNRQQDVVHGGTSFHRCHHQTYGDEQHSEGVVRRRDGREEVRCRPADFQGMWK